MIETPTGWRTVPFWTLFSRTKRIGFADEQLLSVYRDYGVVRRDDRDDNLNRLGADPAAYQLVNVGDLAVNKMKTWQGSLGVSPYRGIISPAYFVYEAITNDDPKFLHYALRSDRYIENYMQISKGVRPNQWDLQPEYLDSMRVLLPTLETQRRIAHYLDRETGQIDAMISKLGELSEQLKHLGTQTTAVFGLDDRGEFHEEDVNSPLAGIPDHWDRSKFGYEFTESTELNGNNPPGPLLSISEYRGVELNTRSDGQQASLDVSKYRVVRPGQLAANMMWLNHGGLGVSELTGYISPDYKAFWISERFEPRYVHYLFRSRRYIQYFGTIATGVRPNAQRVTKTSLDLMPIPVPPLEEQRRIADHLDDVTSKIDAMLAKVAQLKDLLTERRAALITDVVTGRKDVA